MTTTINYEEKKRIHANAKVSASVNVNTVTRTNTTVAIACITGITDDTTLNELISLANNAIEKPKTTLKFATLRNKCRNCIASFKNAMFDLRVYDCGYAGYNQTAQQFTLMIPKLYTSRKKLRGKFAGRCRRLVQT